MKTGRIAQIQVPYNAADRAVETDILPAAAELGIGVIAMQPLGGGGARAARAFTGSARASRTIRRAHLAQALLKWILSDPRVHCAIPATSNVEHMKENAAAGIRRGSTRTPGSTWPSCLDRR
jgi:aryl-alcohol dehydrogenase-like predicted oxidoreductase